MSELGQQLIATVRAKAAENPDYVYRNDRGCVYIENEAPSCIVGHALWDAGLVEPEFEDTYENGTSIHTLVDRGVFTGLDDEEVEWLRWVQREQDGGTPWGEAVEVADAG